jgi:ribonucleoside-diphosphate reductase beta chain
MVELEDKFIDLTLSMGAMDGLSSEDVKKYIRYILTGVLYLLVLKVFLK